MSPAIAVTLAPRPIEAPTLVVSMRGHRDDTEWRSGVLYLGRAMYMGGWDLPGHPLANQFKAKKVGGAVAAASKYRGWLLDDPERVHMARAMRGLTLGCWCVDEDPARLKEMRAEPICHCQIVAMVADGWIDITRRVA